MSYELEISKIKIQSICSFTDSHELLELTRMKQRIKIKIQGICPFTIPGFLIGENSRNSWQNKSV